jgi:Reverse transcriptase (RNA-dependent DNA polymerase)
MVGLEFARGYIDDLLVVSKENFETHIQHLEQVLTRLAKTELKINASKSSFCCDKLEYLGHIINYKRVKQESVEYLHLEAFF